MTILRWKAQSLQFHRHLTGPESVASRQGILPLFAKLAFVIASCGGAVASRSEEHTSELQSLMRISYAVFCLKNKNTQARVRNTATQTTCYYLKLTAQKQRLITYY